MDKIRQWHLWPIRTAWLLPLVIGMGFGWLVWSEPKVEMVVEEQQEEVIVAEPVETRLLVFGDSGNGSAEQKAIRDLMVKEEFDAVLHTGDLIYESGTAAEFLSRYHAIYPKEIRDVFYPSIGNHDNQSNNAAAYLTYFELPTDQLSSNDRERYYSVDIENVHLVSLDTTDSLQRVSASRNDDMADWLRADLAAVPEDKVILVFFHHPPFTFGLHPPAQSVRTHLIPIFDEFNVDIVFAGHEHNYQRFCPMTFSDTSTNCVEDGVSYVVTGGGGRDLYALSTNLPSNVETAASQHHYVRLLITEDKTIQLEAVNISGQVIDSVVYK